IASNLFHSQDATFERIRSRSNAFETDRDRSRQLLAFVGRGVLLVVAQPAREFGLHGCRPVATPGVFNRPQPSGALGKWTVKKPVPHDVARLTSVAGRIEDVTEFVADDRRVFFVGAAV